MWKKSAHSTLECSPQLWKGKRETIALPLTERNYKYHILYCRVYTSCMYSDIEWILNNWKCLTPQTLDNEKITIITMTFWYSVCATQKS